MDDHHQMHFFRTGALILLVALTGSLTGCWSMTALDTKKNPPPPATAERWQLTEQLAASGAGHGTFDDTAYYVNADAAAPARLRCPYALTPNPVAKRRWFWNVFMPMPLGTNLLVACEGGPAQNISPGWDKEQLRQVARTWHQLAHLPDSSTGLIEFGRQAGAWRALPEPPPMPEAVRQYKVAAEAAVREKQWQEAIRQYRKALALDPLWPQGHFNQALLFAEVRMYESAGIAMQKYLLLVPDAANARQAQDKIYEWKAQISRAQP